MIIKKFNKWLATLIIFLVIGTIGVIIFVVWNQKVKATEIPLDRRFSSLEASKQEPEYKENSPLPVSSVGTDYTTASETNLPAGSALLTDTLDGSGNGTSQLHQKGIAHIVHAAPKPRSNFSTDEDFISCVVKSIQNSIILADRNNFEKLAIPFVGGGIYLGNCNPQKLVKGIVAGAVNQLEKCQNLKRISFISWGDNDYNHFLEVYENLEFSDAVSRDNNAFGRLKSNPEKLVGINKGDIRNKNIHGASAIVNAANTYVGFGSGVSGAIVQEVGDRTKIEAKAQEWIKKFNSQIK